MSRTDVTIRRLGSEDLDAICMLLARGMQDNPNPMAVLRGDEASRTAVLQIFMRAMMTGQFYHGYIDGAFLEGQLVGVAGSLAPGCCQPSLREKLSSLPLFTRTIGLSAMPRLMSWFGNWAKHDLKEPHWHLGPVAVDPTMRRAGIGTVLMTSFADRMDRENALGYLETDRPENVNFYVRFGFETVAEDTVIGVPNWFMVRRPNC